MEQVTSTPPPPTAPSSWDVMDLRDKLTRLDTRLPYELRLLDQKFTSLAESLSSRLRFLEQGQNREERAQAPIDTAGWIKVAAAAFLLVTGMMAVATGGSVQFDPKTSKVQFTR